MAKVSNAVPSMRDRHPEEKKSGWDDWEVRECLWLLIRQKEEAERARKIRANEALMKKIRAQAARDLEEKRHERIVLTQLAKS